MTLADVSEARLGDSPEKIAVIDGELHFSFANVHSRAVNLAAALHAMGLRAGDVISFQLPNWHETMIINLAATMGGLVCNPIIPIYRDAEVSHILADSRAKAIFVPHVFRGMDYAEMVSRVQPSLPNLRHLISVRAKLGGYHEFDALIRQDGKLCPTIKCDADAVKLVLYTSGTTAKPKGVLHSHNTLRAEIDAVIGFWQIGSQDVVLMASPVTHITGYLYALELCFAAGITAVLMDQWNAASAIELMNAHHVSFSVGATPFLSELVAALADHPVGVPSFRLFACGGAPVPPELILRAASALPSSVICRVYGSSEAPTISLGVSSVADVGRGASTDGLIVNHEVKIVDSDGRVILVPDQDGEILTCSPELMLGYTDPAETAAAFDAEGFFLTGDVGSVSADGFITLSGRKKDIIIRGGENISPKEIEDALHRHPAVDQVAVVAMPHKRMGETPAAFVVTTGGSKFSFEDMITHLGGEGLARQKFPEHLEIVSALPRNPAGKILKSELRSRFAEI